MATAWRKLVKRPTARANLALFAGLLSVALGGLGTASGAADQADLRETAFAYLWNEQADRAVACFRRYLQENPQDHDRRTLHGLALACAWSGRQDEAVRIYRRLLEDQPADADAGLGLGRSLIWRNDLRPGWRQVRRIERTAADPQAGAAARFALTVLDEYATESCFVLDASWDSDDLDIQRATALGAFAAAGGLVRTGPRISRFVQTAQPDLHAWRWQLGYDTALRRNLTLHSQGWIEQYRSEAPLPGRTDKLDWTRPGGDAWLTWLPTDRLRLDAGGSSLPVETYTALDREIGFAQANLSGDWRLTRRFTLGAVGKLADYSDGNLRRQGQLRAAWRYEGPVHLWTAVTYTYLDFRHPYPGGYWAPDWVRNGSLEAAVRLFGDRWTVKAAGSIGREKETSAGAITVGGGSLRIGRRVHPDWLVALEGGHSRSSLNTASGYHRTFAQLSLRGFF